MTLEISDICEHPLFVGNPAAAWMSDAETTRFIAANDAAIAKYGYRREEWLQMKLADLHLAGDLGSLRAPTTEAVSSHRVGRWRFQDRSGRQIIAELTVIPLITGDQQLLLIVATDVTRVVRLESELRASEERARQLLVQTEASSQIVFTVSPMLRVISWNASAGRQLTLATMPGRAGLNQIVAPEHLKATTDALGALLKGQEIQPFEVDLLGCNGMPLPVEIRAQVVHRDGHVAGIQCVATDVSDRRRLRDRLAHEQKFVTLGRLAGGLAHDLNNLLTVILGYTEECESSPVEAVKCDCIRQVKAATERAADFTKRLLAFGRRKALAPRPVDVNDVIRGASMLVQRVLGDQVHLSVNLAPTVLPVLSDPSQIEQLLVNLAANARDAMPHGGRFTIETSLIATACDGPTQPSGGGTLRITVKDTGQGMTPDVRAHVFEPFFTTKSFQNGTGLGLATVADLVHQAGGAIEVESEPQRGTCFRILLPVVADIAVSPSTRAVAPSEVRGGTETVIVVEPDPAVRRFMATALDARGYTVLTAGGIYDGLELCTSSALGIQLLITDGQTGTIDGTILVTLVRQRFPDMPILLVTNGLDNPSPSGSFVTEPPFLAKPFTATQLARAVRQVLDRGAHDREA